MNPITISGFKAYDLRGRIPSELNEDVAYRIGRAYAEFVKPKKVIVGRDIRLSSEELAKADFGGVVNWKLEAGSWKLDNQVWSDGSASSFQIT